MITLSALQQVAACPGSASLPRLRRASAPASLGHAIHELAETIIGNRYGGADCITEPQIRTIAACNALSPDDAGRLTFLASHLRLPVPAGALAEVPLGYWPDGSVRRFTNEEMAAAHAAGLRYPDAGQWLSGTVDAVWAEPEPFMFHSGALTGYETWTTCPDSSTAWLVDWKTGDDEHVPPIDRNWQLRAGALLAARWTGAARVIPAICYVNAAECAAWLREHPGEPYEGRWEVGAPLDAAALDAIEVEMRAVLAAADPRAEWQEQWEHEERIRADIVRDLRAVLARARGEEDEHADREEDCWRAQRRPVQGTEPRHALQRIAVPGGANQVPESAAPVAVGRSEHVHALQVGAAQSPLILGPHCEHCPARGACPALAAEALTLARADGAEGAREGLALAPETAARLISLIPAIRRACDAAEVAVQAHVRATGRPLALPNGQEYGHALEPTERFVTRPTYDALAELVGDDRAEGAFLATEDRLKAALRGERKRLGRGEWDAFRETVKARGGVVPGAREVWRKRWVTPPNQATIEERMDQYVDRSGGPDACWPWTGQRTERGYGRVRRDGTRTVAHRVAYELANGPIPDGLNVLHRCDNPPCVNPAHLFVGSQAENVADAIDKDRFSMGEEHPFAKLSEEDVRTIRARRQDGALLRELAADFGVGTDQISRICTGKWWKHVGPAKPAEVKEDERE